MTREAWIWGGLAVLTLLWCGMAAAGGAGMMIPFLATSLSGLCAVNAGARERVSRALAWTFSGSALRSGLIVVSEILDRITDISFVRFVGEDVVRHQLVQRIVAAYDDHAERTRSD